MNQEAKTINCQITEFFSQFHHQKTNRETLTSSFFSQLLLKIQKNADNLFPQFIDTRSQFICHLLQFLEQKAFRDTIKCAISFILEYLPLYLIASRYYIFLDFKKYFWGFS